MKVNYSNAIVLFITVFTGVSCSSPSSVPSTLSFSIPNNLKHLNVFTKCKYLECRYDTNRSPVALSVVRFVDCNDQLSFPLMEMTAPGYTGLLGGVEYYKCLEPLRIVVRANEGRASRIIVPHDSTVSKIVLCIREIEIGEVQVESVKWRYFEFSTTDQNYVQIPNATKLPFLESNHRYLQFFKTLPDAETEFKKVSEANAPKQADR